MSDVALKISKCKFVAMTTKGQTEILKTFDFLEIPSAAHYKSW